MTGEDLARVLAAVRAIVGLMLPLGPAARRRAYRRLGELVDGREMQMTTVRPGVRIPARLEDRVLDRGASGQQRVVTQCDPGIHVETWLCDHAGRVEGEPGYGEGVTVRCPDCGGEPEPHSAACARCDDAGVVVVGEWPACRRCTLRAPALDGGLCRHCRPGRPS